MKRARQTSPVSLSSRTWDIHEASAPYESDRWAATDRGWLFHGCGTSLGHYLDYGPRDGQDRSPDGNVHACAIRHSDRTLSDGRHVCDVGATVSRYFRTCEEARAWIEAQACACHRGATCNVAHDPAECSCSQCVTAEGKARA